MARKRRLQQRVKAIGEQVEESIRQDAEDSKLESIASDELFQIDTLGGRVDKKQKLKQKDPLIKSKKFVPEKANKYESKLVKKLQAQQPAETEPVKAKKAANDSSLLWGSDGATAVDERIKQLDEFVAPAVVKKIAQPKRVASTRHKVKKVAVPAPGQSYNPDFDSHQDVLAAAVAQELERQEKRKEQLEPLATGMSAETLEFIKSGDEDEDDDDDYEEIDGAEGATRKRRAPEKLTRSQRNKRARHKQMELEHKAKRGEKALVKQINVVNHILNDIVKDEKQSQQKQELKKVLAEQKLEEEPLVKVAGKLTKLERDTPVLLSDELTGSLRTMRPKGNPLLDRFDSLHKRNMIEVNHSRGKQKRKVKIIEVKK
ncbi:hypothetical protein ATCC90586_005878 [Pythium insidiosum]|nr:hypothetical protein ATCC90586_005878 [Pythium insidiosum]